jgi:HlyD family secretion protein
MQVDTNVAEADVGRLHEGQEASFTVDAYPGQRFKGTVRQIRNAPQTVQNVVTYDAVIDVDNADLKLKPGMTANATFVVAERDDVLRAPNAALRFRPPPELMAQGKPDGGGRRGGHGPEQSDRRTVWALRGPSPEPVPVQVGVTDGSFTELVEGALKEGDALVTESVGGEAASKGGGPPGGQGGANAFRRMF